MASTGAHVYLRVKMGYNACRGGGGESCGLMVVWGQVKSCWAHRRAVCYYFHRTRLSPPGARRVVNLDFPPLSSLQFATVFSSSLHPPPPPLPLPFIINMSAHTTDSSACLPARHHKSPCYNVIASLITILNLAASFLITSIALLARLIAWFFCSIFIVVYKLLFKANKSSTVAPSLISTDAHTKRGPMLIRPPAPAPEVVPKDHAPALITHIVHPRPYPIYPVASRANLSLKPVTSYRSTARHTFTATETRRAPDASFAPGSAIFTRREIGKGERCARTDARIIAEEEAEREQARQIGIQGRAAVNEIVAADIQRSLTSQVTPSSPSSQALPPCDTSVPESAFTWAAAVHAARNDICASPAPCPLVVASSFAAADDTAMDWDSSLLEPELASTDDVVMDDDTLCPSDEPMDDVLSPTSASSSSPPATRSPIFSAISFFDVIVTSAEEDNINIVRLLRACSLSGAEHASPVLPASSMDAEFPALDAVAATLSACTLAEHLDPTEVDANGDIDMANDNDNDDEMSMDVDVPEDMEVDCDDLPAFGTVLSSILGSGRRVSRLVKRHQRTRTRVEHPPHDSTPPPKPNVTTLRLVDKYADFGINVEGVMFRVQLDVGLGKVVKASRMV
ncbi:hypothetical protein BOTBODRAFT_190264 [Botryobasidium botryosum FD-172 SS1]|uniref:Uncharacterized protein n=1 Tax=Botryobasidium botryosum (strain FD-172 SS1) TaxID=930990 RepID=A0A067MGV7_BOTB1|nr:hypothetical protein BOTBODRAFT_190264 [Botryobasidium botryosum FD-172 SS1]